MQMEGKYSSIKQSLENTSGQTIPCPTQDTGLKYFKALSQLSLDILLEQNEINQLQQKIQWMKSKYNSTSAKIAFSKRRKDDQKRIIHCQHEDCGVAFIKDKDLHYHKLFEHESESLFRDGVFSFRVQEEYQRE